MPWLDVNELLLDPMLAGETVTVTRRQDVIGANGRTTPSTTTFPIIASVQPTSSNSLVREEAYQSKTKSIKVITATPLYGPEQAAGTNYQPDLITWHGDSFIVRAIDDFSNFGGGMISAECTSIDLVDQAAP
jgi:hypothetical protein